MVGRHEAGDTQPVGLIIPPAGTSVPIDAHRLYPDVEFMVRGLGLNRMEEPDYVRARERILGRAEELAQAGVASIGIMGTSLTFFEGAAGNRAIERDVYSTTGVPCVSMSSATVLALSAVGSSQPLVASAYSSEVHQRLLSFLAEAGFGPIEGPRLDLVDIKHLERVSPLDLASFGANALEGSDMPGDCLLLSCGGFVSRGVVTLLEDMFDIPVVSSASAGAWAAVAAAGYDSRVPSSARFLSETPSV